MKTAKYDATPGFVNSNRTVISAVMAQRTQALVRRAVALWPRWLIISRRPASRPNSCINSQ